MQLLAEVCTLPPSMDRTLIIGTRKSALAVWQTQFVAEKLRAAHPGIRIEVKQITTSGDRIIDTPLPEIGGKGLFTAELEEAIKNNAVHLAVHSLKDLPTEMADTFVIGAVCSRESPADVLISRGRVGIDGLPPRAVIGTSSLRRAAQMRRLRPDIVTTSIRGNVDTRVRKARDPQGVYDAIIIAEAGLARLGLSHEIDYRFTYDQLLPAPAQGAIAVQCRKDDQWSRSLLQAIDDLPTRLATTAERRFLHDLGAGCSTPVAALAEARDGALKFIGRTLSEDGAECIEVNSLTELAGGAASDFARAESAGASAAAEALRRGYKPNR